MIKVRGKNADDPANFLVAYGESEARYMVEVEAVRTEYGNARLECIAADERAKLLAYEVIGLEEKVPKTSSIHIHV
nr:RNA polymerase II associated factor Paf1 [Tanacetum cinerariifolium]